MGCFGGSPAPPQIDTNALIQQQAQANRVNQTTPFGSSTYSKDPTGQWSNTVTLNPLVQQQLTNQQQLGASGSSYANQMLPYAYGQMSGGFNPNGAASQSNISGGMNLGQYGGGIQTGFKNPQATGNVNLPQGPPQHMTDLSKFAGGGAASTNAGNVNFDRFTAPTFDLNSAYHMAYDPQMALLNPQYDRLQNQQDAKLAAQGISLGSGAYKTAQNLFDDSRNNAYTQVAANSLQQGLGAQQQQYGQASNTYGQNFNAANQEVQNRLQQAGINNQAASINSQAALGMAGLSVNQDALRAQINNNAFNQQLAQQQLGNQTAGQNYAQNLGLAAFGNQAQNQGFNQWLQGGQLGLQNAALGNQAQQQAYGQQLGQYGLPLQTLQAFAGLNQPNSPNFASPTTLDVTGPASLNYQGQLAAYNNANQGQQGMLGGLFGMGSGILNMFGGG